MTANVKMNRAPPWPVYPAMVFAMVVASALGSPLREDIPDIPSAKVHSERFHLSEDLRPIHYDIYIQTSIEDGRFTGFVNISFLATNNTDLFIINALDLEVYGEKITDSASRTTIPIDSKLPWEAAESIVYQTKVYLPLNRQLNYIANFSGKHLENTNLGFYRSYYMDSGSTEKRWYAETQFQATNARRAFPCFDEPRFRTPFVVNIGHSSTLNAFSNTRLESITDPDNNGIVWSRFQPTPPMPTYLVAFAVNDFVSTGGDWKIWAPKDVIARVKESERLATLYLHTLENWTRQPYALNKLDQIASRGHQGAMENWGLIIYAERALADHPNATTLDTIEARMTLAHELAHQWFGNLVTLKSWDTVWLSEGFATFMQYLVVDEVKNEWNLWDLFSINVMNYAFAADESVNAQPITHNVVTPEEILANFNTLSYSKGASILRMLQHAVGADTFRKGVQKYLNVMQMGNAVPEDLSEAISHQAQADHTLPRGIVVQRVLDTWTTQAGYPLITVTRDRDRLFFKQERFYPERSKESTESWWVPISVSTDSTYVKEITRPSLWMAPGEGAMLEDVGESSWILVNRERTGYFRVNYDTQNWVQLAVQLQSSPSIFSATDIAMLINDAAALVFSGRIEPDILMVLLSYLPLETRTVPWVAATNVILERLSPKFGVHQDEETKIYQAWLQSLIENAYTTVGYDQKPGEVETNRVLRLSLFQLAREANSTSFVLDTTNDSLIDNDNEEAHMCSKIQFGSNIVFVEAVSNILNSDTDAFMRMRMIRSLTCTRDPAALRLLLTYSVTDSGFSDFEKSVLWNKALTNANATDLALDILKCNHNTIISRKGSSFLASRILSIAKYLDNDYQLLTLRKYIALYITSSLQINKETRLALEIVRKNIEWNMRYRPQWIALMKSLSDTQPPKPPTPTQPPNPPTSTQPPNPPTSTQPPNPPTSTQPPNPPTSTQPPEPPTPTPPQHDYRLPVNLVPTHYDVKLNPNLEDFTLQGEVVLTGIVEEETNRIVLHSVNLTVINAKVTNRGTGEEIKTESITTDPVRQFLFVPLSQVVQAETELEISISFSGVLSDDNYGFYRSSYEENAQLKWLAATQFEPTYARRAFPCLDEPGFRTTFNITVARLPHYTVLSNMPVVSTSPPDSSGHVWDSFAETPPMATYLVAIIVSEFKPIPISDGTPKITLWARPDITEAVVAKQVSADVFSALSISFEWPQPVPKYDFVALPDFNLGAMENWGLITFKEYRLVNSNDTAGTAVQLGIAQIIAHELVHQWFGNLVTVKWWSNLWLQEGMATFMSYLAVEKIYKMPTARYRLAINEFSKALEPDSTELSSALDADAATPEEIANRADAITYSKGAVVLNMVYSVMGEAYFGYGLVNYLGIYAFEQVDTNSLIVALSLAPMDLVDGLSPAELILSWANQAGYPVVNVNQDYENNSITISQEGRRMLYHPPLNETKEQKWSIPIFLTLPGADDNLVAVLRPTDTQRNIPITTRGLSLINGNRQVPMRVNYDTSKWLAISSTLEEKVSRKTLSPITRAALFDDAFWLARTNRLHYTLALNLIPGYKHEDSTPVFEGARRSLRHLENILRNSSAGHQFSNFLVNEVVEKQYGSLGWSHDPDDDIDVRLRRALLASWACSLNISACSISAMKDYKEWLSGRRVSRDTLPTAICQGLATNGDNDFSTVLSMLFATRKEDLELRGAIIYGLGCNSGEITRKRYISDVLTLNGYQPTDIAPAVDSLVRNGYLDDIIEEVSSNFDSITSSLGWGKAESLLSSLAEQTVTNEHYEKINKIVGGNKVSERVLIGLKVAEDNVMSRENVRSIVQAWLSSYDVPAVPTKPPTDFTYRLPRDIVPKHYYLKLNPQIEESVVEGEIKIDVQVVTRTDVITLHSLDLKLNLIEVKETATNKTVNVTGVEFIRPKNFVKLYLENELPAKSDYVISIHFIAVIQTEVDQYGFFSTSYEDEKSVRHLLATNFAPIHARRAFPCFDEPHFRVPFDFEISRAISQTVLTNTELAYSVSDGMNNRVRDIFQTSPPMSTYHVAIVVSELVPYSVTPSLWIWSRVDYSNDMYPSAVLAFQTFETLSELTNLELPLEKFDLVAVPNAVGSVEGWGLQTFSESDLLSFFNQTISSWKRVSRSVAQGLAYQWFGDAVTLAWWDDAWIKDGIATYLGYEASEPITVGDTYGAAALTHLVLTSDGLETSEPLIGNVSTPQEIFYFQNNKIPAIKGGAIIRLLAEISGRSAFIKGLQSYLDKNKWGAATTQDLVDALQSALENPLPRQVKIGDLVDSWGTQSGYPVLNVKRSENRETVTLSQERFLTHPKLGLDLNADKKWIIPLNYKQEHQQENDVIVDFVLPSDQTRNLSVKPEDWVIFNWNRSAPYRVNYDEKTWEELTQAVYTNTKTFTVADRAGLIDDALWLARTNRLGYPTALNTLSTLNRQSEPFVLTSTYESLRHLDAMLIDKPERKLYQRYIQQKLMDIWQTVGFYPSVSEQEESNEIRLRREILTRWLRDLNHTDVSSDAFANYKKWMNERESVHKDVWPSVLCEGLSRSQPVDLINVLGILLTTEDTSDRAAIVYSLGCYKEDTGIALLLKYATSLRGFKPSEVPTLIDSLASHGILTPAITHITETYDYIVTRLGSQKADEIVLNLADKVCTSSQLEMLETFVGNRSGNLAVAVSIAKENIRWQQISLPVVTTWLHQAINTTPEPPQPTYPPSQPPTQPTPTPMPTTPPQPEQGYRLPNNLIPSHYDIELSPSVEKSLLNGSVEIIVLANEETRSIVLHAEQLTIKEVFVTKLINNEKIRVVEFEGGRHGFLNITLAKPLQRFAQYNVRISYSALIKSQPTGMYSVSYEETDQTKTILATNVYPIYARRIFPCFDEPHLRATYSVKVKRSTQQKVHFNTELFVTRPDPDGLVWDIFQRTGPLASHHFALVVHDDSDLKETRVDGTTSLWTRPSATYKTAFAAKIIPQIFKNIKKYLQTDLPQRKINLVALPASVGSPTGTWGLLISSESRVLAVQDLKEPAYARALVAHTLAYSLLEQFIGNIVTPSWWSDVALKEGLPNLLKYMNKKTNILALQTGIDLSEFAEELIQELCSVLEDIFKEDGLFESTDLQLILDADGLESTSPIQNNVEKPEDIVKHVSTTTGTPFFNMLRAVLGDNVFRRGIQSYLKTKNLKHASMEDFAQILQEVADKNRIKLPRGVKIKDIVDSWKGGVGYPVITAITNINNKIIEVSQERHLSHSPTNSPNLREQRWVVPLIREDLYEGQELVDILLPTDDGQRTVNYKPTALHFNSRRAVKMRVNYDPKTWLELSEGLLEVEPRTIPTEDRIALRNDALTLARTGHLDYAIALEVLHSLINEDLSPSIWISARNSLSHLEGLLHNTKTYDLYTKYMQALLSKPIQEVGWIADPTEKDNIRMTRSILNEWACQLEDPPSLYYAGHLYDTWKSDPNSIQKDVLGAIVCAGLKDGESSDLTHVISVLMSSSDEYERSVIADSIGCYRSSPEFTVILDQAANLMGFTLDETYKIFVSAASRGHITQVITYLSSNYATVEKSLGANLAEKLVLSVANLITNDTDYNKLKQLTEGKTSLVLQEALALAGDNLRWQTTYLPQVTSWFSVSTATPTPPPVTSIPPTTSSPLSPTMPPTTDNYRLNTDLIPQTYTLRLVPYIHNSSIQGSIDISFRVNRPTNIITLNALYIKINAAKLQKNGDANLETINSIHTDEDHQLLHIETASTLTLFSEYTLTLVYEGKIRNDLLGFHSINISNSREEKFVLSTQFSPVFARSAFPCWDEPRFRARFTLMIARQKTETTFSNTPLQSTSGPDATIGGRVWDTYGMTPLLPSYLVAFQVWSHPPMVRNQAYISIWNRADRSEDTTWALDAAISLYRYLEEETGQSSDLTKVDIMAVPDHNFQAMENWGLKTFRENILLLKNNTGVERLQSAALTLGHEISHQWFGNLVTIDWWNNAWLKEGLATLFAHLTLQNTFVGNKWNLQDQFAVEVVLPALRADSLSRVHALSGPVNRPQDVPANLDTITYEKGAAVFSMIRDAITPAIFRDGLRRYVQKRKYLSAIPNDLWEAIQESIEKNNNQSVLPARVPLSVIMNDWAELPGYPILNVERNSDNSEIIITQEPNQPSRRVFTSWFVPVNLQLSTNKSNIRLHWLLRNKPLVIKDVPSSSPWVVANADRKGFFRVNYSSDIWLSLISHLQGPKFKDLSNVTRATLLDDALSLARSGHLDYAIALQITKYLYQEEDYAPLSTARQSLEFLEGILSGTPAETVYRHYMRMHLGILYKKIQWTQKPSDSHELKLKRAVVTPWACRVGWSTCGDNPTSEFQAWRDNNIERPSDETLEATICYGLSDSENAQTYEQIIAVTYQETNSVRRRAYLRGLGCLERDEDINKILSMSINNTRFRPGDAAVLYESASLKSKHRANMTLEFLRSTLPQVLSSLGRKSVEKLLPTLAHRLSDEQQLSSMTSIIKTLEKTQPSPKGREALEILEGNILWMKNSYETVEKTLRNL